MKIVYRCPAGEKLDYRFTAKEHGQKLHRYWTDACPTCPIKAQCTTGNERRITRWEHEEVVEAVQDRLDKKSRCHAHATRDGRASFRHNEDAHGGATHFLCTTLPKVATEMAICVLTYNLTRVLNIVGVEKMIEAITA